MSYNGVNNQEEHTMKLVFDSVEEVRAFVKDELKGGRGKGKSDSDEGTATTGQTAPAPLAPPAASAGAGFPGAGGAAFSPPAGGATFPGPAAATGPAPEVQALVGRIVTRIDGAIASGQPADQVLAWFRGECARGGAGDTTNATMEQIKTIFLPKMAVPALENVAKLMNA